MKRLLGKKHNHKVDLLDEYGNFDEAAPTSEKKTESVDLWSTHKEDKKSTTQGLTEYKAGMLIRRPNDHGISSVRAEKEGVQDFQLCDSLYDRPFE